jgi:hypothetical protein
MFQLQDTNILHILINTDLIKCVYFLKYTETCEINVEGLCY